MNLFALFMLILPTLSLAQSWMPIEKTCYQTGNQVAEEHLKKSLREFESLPDQEALQYLENNFQTYSSFILFNANSKFLADKIVRQNLRYIVKDLCDRITADNSLKGLLIDTKKCSSEILSKPPKFQNNYSQFHPAYYEASAQQLKPFSQLREFFIINFPMLEALPASMASVAAVYSPKYKNIPNTHEVIQISLNPKLRALSEKLNIYLLDLMLDAEKTQQVKGKDIFSDLIVFFQNEGMDNDEAIDYSLRYLGAYATRGADIIKTVWDFHPSSRLALGNLGLAISYLDKIAATKGKNYIIPHQIKTNCHLGKPYHFWLAAFQSYYGIKQNFGHSASYILPIGAGIIYDITTDMNGRDISKLFSIKNPYDHYANITRIDNWARILGSYVGRKMGKPNKINGDEYLIDMFKAAKMPTHQPTETLEMMKEYLRIIKPEPMIIKLAL